MKLTKQEIIQMSSLESDSTQSIGKLNRIYSEAIDALSDNLYENYNSKRPIKKKDTEEQVENSQD